MADRQVAQQTGRRHGRGPAIRSTAAIAGHPIHPMLIPFPIAFLSGAFLSDLAYALTSGPFWARASLWLVGAGVVSAVLAAAFGITDYLGDEEVRRHRAATVHLALNVAAVLLAAGSWWLRAEDPEAAVLPWGIAFSAIWTVLLAVSGWFGGELSYRHGVGHVPADGGAPGERPRRDWA